MESKPAKQPVSPRQPDSQPGPSRPSQAHQRPPKPHSGGNRATFSIGSSTELCLFYGLFGPADHKKHNSVLDPTEKGHPTPARRWFRGRLVRLTQVVGTSAHTPGPVRATMRGGAGGGSGPGLQGGFRSSLRWCLLGAFSFILVKRPHHCGYYFIHL